MALTGWKESWKSVSSSRVLHAIFSVIMDMDFTLEDVVNAYKSGLFPMADSRESDDFYWYDPPLRGQLSIENLHVPERLRRTVLKFPYDIKIDTAFAQVIDGCAITAPDRPETWINKTIRDLFIALHEAGFAHSVEAWKEDRLVGGLYGIAIGGAFMGESMFSRARDASKIALVHLCARLREGGFIVLDTQYTNAHLEQFGVYEIPRDEYVQKLNKALKIKGDFVLSGRSEAEVVHNYLAEI